MVSKTLSIVLGILIWAVPLTSVNGQDATDSLRHLHFESITYPESIDDSNALKSAQGNRTLVSCLGDLQDKWMSEAINHVEECDRTYGNGTQKYRNCLNNDPPTSVFLWSLSFGDTLRNNTPWVETVSGKMAIQGKTYARAIMPELWEQMAKEIITAVKPLLTCQ